MVKSGWILMYLMWNIIFDLYMNAVAESCSRLCVDLLIVSLSLSFTSRSLVQKRIE